MLSWSQNIVDFLRHLIRAGPKRNRTSFRHPRRSDRHQIINDALLWRTSSTFFSHRGNHDDQDFLISRRLVSREFGDPRDLRHLLDTLSDTPFLHLHNFRTLRSYHSRIHFEAPGYKASGKTYVACLRLQILAGHSKVCRADIPQDNQMPRARVQPVSITAQASKASTLR